MSKNTQWSAINRNYQLHDLKNSGHPYIVKLSDIRDLRKGEVDTHFLAHGESCVLTPAKCGFFRRGNQKCGAVEGMIKCPNASSCERSG